MVAHTFNPSFRPAWSIKQVPGQPGLCSETLSQKPIPKAKTNNNKIKVTHVQEQEGKSFPECHDPP